MNNNSMYEYTKEILQLPLYMVNAIPKEKVTEDKKLLTSWNFFFSCLQVAIQTRIDYGFYMNSQTTEKIKNLIKKEEIDAICIEDCLLNKALELKEISFVEDNTRFKMYLELLSSKSIVYLNEIQFMNTPEAWKKYENNLIYSAIDFVSYDQKDSRSYLSNRFFSVLDTLVKRLFPCFRINIIERDFFNEVKKTNKEYLLRHLNNNVIAPISSENNPLNIQIRYFGKNKLEDFQIDKLVALFRKKIYETLDIVIEDERIDTSVEDFYNLVYNVRNDVVKFYDLIYVPNTTASIYLSEKFLRIKYKATRKFSPFRIDTKEIEIFPNRTIDEFKETKEVIKDVFT